MQQAVVDENDASIREALRNNPRGPEGFGWPDWVVDATLEQVRELAKVGPEKLRTPRGQQGYRI